MRRLAEYSALLTAVEAQRPAAGAALDWDKVATAHASFRRRSAEVLKAQFKKLVNQYPNGKDADSAWGKAKLELTKRAQGVQERWTRISGGISFVAQQGEEEDEEEEEEEEEGEEGEGEEGEGEEGEGEEDFFAGAAAPDDDALSARGGSFNSRTRFFFLCRLLTHSHTR